MMEQDGGDRASLCMYLSFFSVAFDDFCLLAFKVKKHQPNLALVDRRV